MRCINQDLILYTCSGRPELILGQVFFHHHELEIADRIIAGETSERFTLLLYQHYISGLLTGSLFYHLLLWLVHLQSLYAIRDAIALHS